MDKTVYNEILNDVMLWQAFAQSTFTKKRELLMACMACSLIQTGLLQHQTYTNLGYAK